MEGLAGYSSEGEDAEVNTKSGVDASTEDSCSHGGVNAAQLETEWEMFQKILSTEEDFTKERALISASHQQLEQNADSSERKLIIQHAENVIPYLGHACEGSLSDQISQDVKLDGLVATQVSQKADLVAHDSQDPRKEKQAFSRSSSPISMDMSQSSDSTDDTSSHSGDQVENRSPEGEPRAANALASASFEESTVKARDVTGKDSASSAKSSSRPRESTADTIKSVKPRSRTPSGNVSKQSHSRSRSSSAARSRLHDQKASRSRLSGQGGKHRSTSKEQHSPSRDRKLLSTKKGRSHRSRSRSGPRSRRSRQRSSSKSLSRRARSRSHRSHSKPRSRRTRSKSRRSRSRSRRSRSKSLRLTSKRRRSRSQSRRSRSRSSHSRSRRSRSHKKTRSDSRRHVERRRKPDARASRPSARNRSSSRHGSRSRRRSRSRSSNRNRPSHRSRSRDHSRSKNRSRDRSRSASRSGRRRSSSVDKRRSPGTNSEAGVKSKVPVQEPHVDFKTKMKMELQKAAKDALEGKCIIDQKSLMTSEKPSLSAILMSGTSEKVTAQQAMMHTLAAMHAKAQELTGVAIPKYYNPAAVNPLKYAEQMQKRKLLWSKTKDTKEATAQWQGTSVVVDEKFRKLMGIREGEVGELSEEQLQKQAELFAKLDHEYAFARMATHTHRGMGLGAVSSVAATSTYTPAEPQPSQPKSST